MIEERYELSLDRIRQIQQEQIVQEPYNAYFSRAASFLVQMTELYKEIEQGQLQKDSLTALQERNTGLYQELSEEAYKKSFANPDYAVETLGEAYGNILSFLYTEMRSLIVYAYEQRKFEMVIRMELFLEVYHAFSYAYEEEKGEPDKEQILDMIYWFVSDYSEPEMESRIKEQLDPSNQFAIDIIKNSNLEDIRYLYYYGEYISENELLTAKHLNELPDAMIAKIADTYTEGYRMGFILGNKDLSKKKVVNIRYQVGFERVVRRAIQNFEEMGLEPTAYRAGVSVFTKRGNLKIGYYGATINKQYEYDHKEDEALFLDKKLIHRKLEIMKEMYEQEKEWANLHAGPACIEMFGEKPFNPLSKEHACRLSEAQQKLMVEYASKSGSIVNEYIKGEESSYTIIAFPFPEIGTKYKEIFDEIVKINTLDYQLYAKIQQTIIDTLDTAEYVHIKGGNGNRTDMKVALHTLKNPQKETIFENCVADVNIPVGEVFTSPKLTGTNGTLHVSRVFLNELEYKELEIIFENGMITSYRCANFETEKENQKYIRDNVLFHHETLPIGEFAIGTNTTAYMVARRYGIADKLPILIAEKMGPHFAVGDTCYSHSEDVAVFNPNGKEIIARENEVSMLRKEDMAKAYFNCHTDITIPYDELQSIEAVTATGDRIFIIENGQFVLKGCEELNIPFKESAM